MTLSILIPTILGREKFFNALHECLTIQVAGKKEVEIIISKDNREKSIGQKRNELLQQAKNDYSVFIDDDDTIPDYYIDEVLKAIRSNPDVVSFMGNYILNGEPQKEFIHSLKYREYDESMYYYYRPPNHLNPMRTEIAKQFYFPLKSMFEDTDWAMQIAKAGVLKTEYYIDKIMYNYQYVSNKKH